MAVTRIKAYHTESSMHNGLNYSADPEKSAFRDKPPKEKSTEDISRNLKHFMDTSSKDQSGAKDTIGQNINLSHVFSYTVNPDKTHIGKDGDVDILVSGHHCNPDLAEVDFRRCRGLYYMNGHHERTGYAKAKRPIYAIASI